MGRGKDLVDTTMDMAAMDEMYNIGRLEADKAKAELEARVMESEALGKIKAADFNIKTNELLKFVTLHQVKQSKEYKKRGKTWGEFCESIGMSVRTVDQILSELKPLLKQISAVHAETLGMPLNKIRLLGCAISADLAEIEDNTLRIGDHRIEIIPENKEEIEAAIDLMKDAREKEQAEHKAELEKKDKLIERHQKHLDTLVKEETQSLRTERDEAVKDLQRFKMFDPQAGKDLSWSADMMKEVLKASAQFASVCRTFILDERLEDHIELQAEVEGFMTQAEMILSELRRFWTDRFCPLDD